MRSTPDAPGGSGQPGTPIAIDDLWRWIWRRLVGPYSLAGTVVMALVAALAWLLRADLRRFFAQHPSGWSGLAVGLLVLSAATAATLWIESEALRHRWRRRTRQATGLDRLTRVSWLRRLVGRLPDPLELVSQPVLRTRMGQRLTLDWQDARYGDKPSRYLLLLGLAAGLGWVIGGRIGGNLLSLSLALVLPMLPIRLVAGRAARERRRFGEQLPIMLEALSAGMSAGLSFQQAVDYAEQELSHPMSAELGRLARRMALGHPVDAALRSLLEERDDEALYLVVEGIALQRQFGGDMVRMLGEMAELLRERVDLEQEVRAVATQGRLSGYVIGALVPVSAGVLLIFNPRYIDVLFDTLIGQILVLLVIVLQLTGWAIISRLMRLGY